MTEITFDDFKKAEIKIGTILSAEKVAETDKLLRSTATDSFGCCASLSRPRCACREAGSSLGKFANPYDSRTRESGDGALCCRRCFFNNPFACVRGSRRYSSTINNIFSFYGYSFSF
jgi:hypothetical protein